MITGVETAGLVLAVLPLIISALEHYNEGIKPLKDFVRYKQVIRELVVDLSTQKALFRNTLEKLLSSSVASDLKLALLLEHPGGEGWRDDDLASDLKCRLEGSYDVYMASVNDMEGLVKNLQEGMGLNKRGEPEWIDARGHKKAWKKFLVCLSRKDHEKILARMDQDNRNLKNLTKDSLDLEPVRLHRRKVAEPFRKIRDYAKSLHKVLKFGWSCTCKHTHSANLRLEIRECDAAPSFRVLFPASGISLMHSSVWQATDIRPLAEEVVEVTSPPGRDDTLQMTTEMASLSVTDSKTYKSIVSSSLRFSVGMALPDHTEAIVGQRKKSAQSSKKVSWAKSTKDNDNEHGAGASRNDINTSASPQIGQLESSLKRSRIHDLCHVLAKMPSMHPHETCLGCLVDEDRYLGVYANGSHSGTSTSTLDDILQNLVPPDQGPHMNVTKKQRLQIAVTLASTALQLQETAWVDGCWGKKDILFHHGHLEDPYISKMFQKEVPELQQPNSRGKKDALSSISPIRNEALFNLGVLLLELSYGKSLDDFKSAEDPPIFTEYAIARRLVEDLTEEAASGYVDAVRACIFCDFRTKINSMSLDNDSFRQAVYNDVVVPLEEEWKHWNKRL